MTTLHTTRHAHERGARPRDASAPQRRTASTAAPARTTRSLRQAAWRLPELRARALRGPEGGSRRHRRAGRQDRPWQARSRNRSSASGRSRPATSTPERWSRRRRCARSRRKSGYRRLDRLIGVYSRAGERIIFIAFGGSVIGGEFVAGEGRLEVGTFDPSALPELAFPHDAASSRPGPKCVRDADGSAWRASLDVSPPPIPLLSGNRTIWRPWPRPDGLAACSNFACTEPESPPATPTAVDTATATPEPTSTPCRRYPTPVPQARRPEAYPFPPNLAASAETILKGIETLRGTPSLAPVDMFLLSRDQARAYYGGGGNNGGASPSPQPRLRPEERAVPPLGLIPARSSATSSRPPSTT